MLLHQSGSRSQRTKGFKVKQTLQVTLLLAVGCWLLYQIPNSHDKNKVYATNVVKKLSKEEASIVLGRKGSRDSDRNRVEGSGKIEDGGDGDDVLDRNVDEKSEEESQTKTNSLKHKEREELEEDNQKELVSNQEKYQSQLQSNEEASTITQPRDLGEAMSSDTNEDTRRSVDETALSPSEVEGTTTDQKEAGNEGGGFQDVNGVPPGHKLVNVTPDEIIRDVDETTDLDQETASGPNNQLGLGENTTLVLVELGKSSELNGTNDVDMTIDDKVIEREIVQYNEISETSQDLTSVPSEKEEETMASLKMMLPQGGSES